MIQLLSSATQQTDDMEERVTVFTEWPSIKIRSNTHKFKQEKFNPDLRNIFSQW